MANVLPILLIGGAAAFLVMGDKKKKSGKKEEDIPKPKAGDSCEGYEVYPEGLDCVDGIFVEDELETDEEANKEFIGEFDMDEEDVGPAEDDDFEAMPVPEPEPEPVDAHVSFTDPSKACEDFLSAVYVSPEPGELPINEIAVAQTVIPAMNARIEEISKNVGKPLDLEIFGPELVVEALSALVPPCVWKYDDTNGQFVYNDTYTIESESGQQVVYGLMELSTKILEEFNEPGLGTSNGGFQGSGMQIEQG